MQEELDAVQVPADRIVVGGVQHGPLLVVPPHHLGHQVELVPQEVVVLDAFLEQPRAEGEESGDGQNDAAPFLPGHTHQTPQLLQQDAVELQVPETGLPVDGELQEGAVCAVGPQQGEEGEDVRSRGQRQQGQDQGPDGVGCLLQLHLPAVAVGLGAVVHVLQVPALADGVGQLVHAPTLLLLVVHHLHLGADAELALLSVVPAEDEGEAAVDKEGDALGAKPAGGQAHVLLVGVPTVVRHVLHLQW